MGTKKAEKEVVSFLASVENGRKKTLANVSFLQTTCAIMAYHSR